MPEYLNVAYYFLEILQVQGSLDLTFKGVKQ